VLLVLTPGHRSLVKNSSLRLNWSAVWHPVITEEAVPPIRIRCTPLAMRHFKHEQPMESPLGLKLREAGFDSLWSFLTAHGFTNLDSFRSTIGFDSLIPVGFHDFLLASADIDDNWPVAFRVAAADLLNNARERYRETSPSPDWIVIQPVSKLASQFGDEIEWASPLTFVMRDYLLENRNLFDSAFAYNDEWLVDIVDSNR
ncbi:MAG: hypothetical protein AAF802_33105, partial [Planctomycetota bacterium]